MADSDSDVVVRTEVITGGGQAFPIDYHLIKVGATWKVYDVVVEGASLVTTYRGNFNQTIQKDGIDGLIKALTDRNAAPTAKSQN
jgi:phospholipid transport system substrate-binding protein